MRWSVAAGMLVAAMVGCATTEMQPSAAVTSLTRRIRENVIGQRLEWVPQVIPALGRVYFEIPQMPPAAQYRVTVWAYDRIKGGGSAS